MKTKILALVAGLSVSATALARDHRPDKHRFGPRPEACDDVKLTDAQRAQMKDAFFKFEDERIDLEAKERHARLDVRRLLAAKEADPKAVRKAAQAAAEAASKLRTAEELQRTDVLLSFAPDQREAAMRCGPRFAFEPRHRPGDEPRPRGPAGAPDDDQDGE